jgi:hypothetical protein
VISTSAGRRRSTTAATAIDEAGESGNRPKCPNIGPNRLVFSNARQSHCEPIILSFNSSTGQAEMRPSTPRGKHCDDVLDRG